MNINKLNNPYQESLLIEAQATYYPHMISVYIPKDPIFRKPTSDPKVLKAKYDDMIDNDIDTPGKESILERSIRRTKKRVSDYALCNDFDMFVTFTFATDRQNSDAKKAQMKTWLKNQRTRNGKFDYLLVPEFHKDGKSLHFHALMSGYSGKIIPATHPETGKSVLQNGRQVYVLSGYTLGFNNVKLLGKSYEDRTKVAAYIKKYITKDMPIFHGKQRYWASKGLTLPRVEDNPEHWYKQIEPSWSTETPNGEILRFNIGENPISDIYLESSARL